MGAAIDVSGRSVVAAAKRPIAGAMEDDSDYDEDDFSDSASQWDMEEVEVTEEDERALAAFMVTALLMYTTQYFTHQPRHPPISSLEGRRQPPAPGPDTAAAAAAAWLCLALQRPAAAAQRTLADVIMEKIRQKQEESGLEEGGLPGEDGLPVVGPRMDPKVTALPRPPTPRPTLLSHPPCHSHH